MPREDIQFIFQIISTISVIISFFYLGYQIYQNTKTMRRAASRDIVRDLNELGKFFIEKPDLISVYFDIMADSENLSPVEQFRFRSLLMYVFSNFDLALTYHQDGLISDESVNAYTESVSALLASSYVLSWWKKEGQNIYSKNLKERINQTVQSKLS